MRWRSWDLSCVCIYVDWPVTAFSLAVIYAHRTVLYVYVCVCGYPVSVLGNNNTSGNCDGVEKRVAARARDHASERHVRRPLLCKLIRWHGHELLSALCMSVRVYICRALSLSRRSPFSFFSIAFWISNQSRRRSRFFSPPIESSNGGFLFSRLLRSAIKLTPECYSIVYYILPLSACLPACTGVYTHKQVGRREVESVGSVMRVAMHQSRKLVPRELEVLSGVND